MVDGRLRHQWEQTAWIAAAAYNAMGSRIPPHKLNPYRRGQHVPDDSSHDLDGFFGIG